MNECEREFSSQQCGDTLPEIMLQLKVITEKRTFIQQATKVVLSQGRKFQDMLSSVRARTKSSVVSPEISTSRVRKYSCEVVLSSSLTLSESHWPQSSDDLLEEPLVREEPSFPAMTKQIKTNSPNKKSPNTDFLLHSYSSSLPASPSMKNRHRNSLDNHRSDFDNGAISSIPKHLSPKHSAGNLKSAHSVPNVYAVGHNHGIVEEFLEMLNGKLALLMDLWEGRDKRLQEAKKAVEFTEAAPHILEWVNLEGAEFLKQHNHYGRSLVEVG